MTTTTNPPTWLNTEALNISDDLAAGFRAAIEEAVRLLPDIYSLSEMAVPLFDRANSELPKGLPDDVCEAYWKLTGLAELSALLGLMEALLERGSEGSSWQTNPEHAEHLNSTARRYGLEEVGP